MLQPKLRVITHTFSIVRTLLQLVWQAHPRSFLISLVFTLLLGVLPAISIWLTSTLVQILVHETSPLPANTGIPIQLITLLGLFAGVHVITQAVQSVDLAVKRLHQTRVTHYLQLLIARKAAEIDLEAFEDPEFHNHMRMAAHEALFRPMMMLNQFMSAVSTITTVVSLAIMVMLWQVWIVPILIGTSVGFLGIAIRFGYDRVRVATERTALERKKHYFSMLLTSEQPAKEIRLFGLGTFLLDRLQQLLETTYQQDRRLALRELVVASSLGTLLALVQPALVAFVSWQVIQGVLSIGQFSLYTQSIGQLQSGLTQLMFLLGGFHENMLFASKLVTFLAVEPRVEVLGAKPSIQPPTIRRLPRIEFRNVSFHYPGMTKLILDKINFVIEPGESIALVGENGAGKSTIVKLLSGLYLPTAGQVLLDDVDINTLDRTVLRSYLSVIFQDYTIYHLSARENIGMARINDMDNLALIRDVAKRADLEHVIAQLPNGYDTVLGRLWESGHELSGGQRQLIALARSLLRDAPILVLDEPSAALDIYTEHRFFESLLSDHDSTRQRTTMFISHRFSSVQRADRILVLQHGHVIEQGSHEMLMQQNGCYAEMFNLQSILYTN